MVLAQAHSWLETIANRNGERVVRSAYRQNVPADKNLTRLLSSLNDCLQL